MKDFSILPKEFSQETEKGKKQLSFSLALRVFLVSIIFLVLPLLFHGYLNYRHHYQQQVKDILLTLNFFNEGRAHFIQRTIQLQKEMLNLVARSLPWGESRELLLKKWNDEWAEENLPFDVFYLDFERRCLFSSKTSLEGKQFPKSESLQRALLENYFSFFDRDWDQKENLLYVTRTILHEGKPIGLLISTSPALFVIESVKVSSPQLYHLDISFLDREGKIVVSSSPLLKGKQLQHDAFFQIVQGVAEGYILKIGGVEFLASQEVLSMPEGSLLATIEKHSFADLHAQHYWTQVLLLFLAFFVIGGGITFFFVWRMSRPLRSLYATMESVSQGNTEARFARDSWGFEINSLGKSFNHMIDSVLKYQKKEEEERLQKEIYQNELKIGREIQESLIVAHLPHFEELDVATWYLPAKEVGGDFYDLFEKDHHVALVMADTSGKGISACLYSLSVRSMLRSFSQDSSDLSEILVKTNRLFCLDCQDTGIFVTLWMGLYDRKKRVLHYVSAGHYPAFLKKKKQGLLELHTSSMALGVQMENSFPFESISLEKGDLLFLYTDGVFDAMGKEEEAFGRKRLKKFLISNDKTTSEEWSTALIEEIEEFTKGMPQYDDMTLMVIRIC
jgi:phosphoserine phosphatase RsbU/P